MEALDSINEDDEIQLTNGGKASAYFMDGKVYLSSNEGMTTDCDEIPFTKEELIRLYDGNMTTNDPKVTIWFEDGYFNIDHDNYESWDCAEIQITRKDIQQIITRL